MAYIESFIYYITVVLFMFIVLFGGVVFLYMLFGQLKIFFSKEEVTWEIEKNFLFKLIKNKFFKFIALAYFATFTFFYINQAIEYFDSDRAYPKAKAYKIVADLVMFHYDFFISNRNMYYRPIGLKFIEPYQKIQEHLMEKGFSYIPQDDAERAIWKYEFFYSQYIKAMAAPIDFEKLTEFDLGYILRIGGHTAIYKPQARDMLKEVELIIDSLIDKPIKDKRYDEVQRYMTTVLYAEWWNKFSYLHYTLGVRTVRETRSQEYRNIKTKWTDDKEYQKRLEKISNWLDITKEKIDNSKALQKMIKKHKLIYPDLMGLRVGLRADLAYADLLNQNFSCELYSLQSYLEKRKEFIHYANNDSVFKSLSWKERTYSDGLVRYDKNGVLTYILNNFCYIDKKQLMYKENIKETWDTKKIQIEKTKKIIEGLKNGR